MTTRRNLGKKMMDIATLSPIVTTARTMKLARQSPHNAAFGLSKMAMEKAFAFGQSNMQMVAAMWRLPMTLFLQSLAPQKSSVSKTSSDIAAAWTTILAAGVAPVHARVKRNARAK